MVSNRASVYLLVCPSVCSSVCSAYVSVLSFTHDNLIYYSRTWYINLILHLSVFLDLMSHFVNLEGYGPWDLKISFLCFISLATENWLVHFSWMGHWKIQWHTDISIQWIKQRRERCDFLQIFWCTSPKIDSKTQLMGGYQHAQEFLFEHTPICKT